jgi:predicted PurR-regulated permease PerM
MVEGKLGARKVNKKMIEMEDSSKDMQSLNRHKPLKNNDVENKKNDINNYVRLALIIGLMVLTFLVTKSMFKVIMGAFLMTYLTYPLYRKLQSKIKFKALSALIIILVALVIMVVLIWFMASSLMGEAYVVYTNSANVLNAITADDVKDCSLEECLLTEHIAEFANKNPELKASLKNQIASIGNTIFDVVKTIIIKLPAIFISLFFVIFLTFFLLIDGAKIAKEVKDILPLKQEHKDEVLNEITKTANSVLFGQILVSLIQGLTGAVGILIGSWIFGISNPGVVGFGIAMAIASLIPFIGTGLVWIPLSASNILLGIINNQPNLWGYGLFILVWGAVAVANIDSITRPKLVSSMSSLHPVVVLVSVFGGLALLGFIGIFIGPIVVGIFFKMLEIYKKEILVKE